MELGIDLYSIEAMCKSMYEPSDAKRREEAEAQLAPLGSSPDNISACLSIASASHQPVAQHFAMSSLLKIINSHWTRISAAQRSEIRQFCLNILAERGPTLPDFVVEEISLVLCRITKLGWNSDGPYKSIVDDVSKFLEASEGHCKIGLSILNRLIAEMNQATPAVRKFFFFSQAQNRKVATSFRDLLLLNIFKMSLDTIRKLSPPPAHSSLRVKALQVAQACLAFDFIGASLDESSEDIGTIHVPVAWRSVVEDPSTLTLFFDTYKASTNVDTEVTKKTIECLVQLSSVRRSLFSADDKRLQYLHQHMYAIVDILQNKRGLDNPDVYHHFCRWLARLKCNHELSELMSASVFSEWIRYVAELTIHCTSSDWSVVGNSLYYLLILWNRLVTSMWKMKKNSVAGLDAYVQQIVETYVTSRLYALEAEISAGDWEDGDDDDAADEQFAEHLESIPGIFRLHYDKTAQFIVQVTDRILDQYKACIQKKAPPSERYLVERHLSWLVRVIGAVVGGRIISTSSESQEHSDGELSSRVFQLMILTVDEDNSRNEQMAMVKQPKGMVELDGAIVDFIQSFRRAYIGEQAVATSKVYVRMADRLGISDHNVVLDVVASKVACILRKYGVVCGTAVIRKTLTLLAELASAHSSGRLLGKLKTIRSMLNNHGEDMFLFMKGPSMGQQRTLFYQTLTRILFSLIGMGEFDPEVEFERFLQPLHGKMEAIAALPDEMLVNDPAVVSALIGIFRDLRGVVTATLLKKTYTMFFDWFYPKHASLLLRAARANAEAGAHNVTIPLLKFYAELVHNKPPRIIFDSSSPNGILLFRETSKILVAYCSATMAHWNAVGRQGTDPYKQLYKGASVCLLMFARALSGNYVNFGVFTLYGDTALSDAMRVSLEIALAIPVKDLLAYQKVARSYYTLMDILCANHAQSIVSVDHEVFVHIVRTVQEGLSAPEVWTQCATALDHLSEFRFRCSLKDSASARSFAAHVERSPNLFPTCLETVFNMILHEDCTNQWSLSRPLLSLILTNEGAFLQLKKQIIESQSDPETQKSVSAAFDKLMTDVQPNLESKNRDRFTSQVAVFRHSLLRSNNSK